MTRRVAFRDPLRAFLGSARLASALSTAAIGLGVFAYALHHTIGWAGLIAMLATVSVLAIASLVPRRDSIDWTGVVPISLLVFLAWALASVFWSQYQWATAGGLAYLIGFTVLGVYVALVRDTIQIIRSFGDVLRFVLGLSLVLELVSGLLIDRPITFLGVGGNLDQLGPIQGGVGNRNELGLLAVIAGISFVIEWRTRSVRTGVAIGSVIGAGITLALTRSPIAFGTAVVAVAAMLVLYGIRRLPIERRQVWQYASLALVVVAGVIAWVARVPIIGALNAGGELNFRLRLWQQVWSLVPLHPTEGWGWIGQWHPDVAPYLLFDTLSPRALTSASNAYLDVWFQLGVIGMALFVLLVGLAFVRSWLLASRQRSVIFTWPAVVLAALLTVSLAESSILIEFGWVTFVICCVKASQNLSWRNAFRRPLEQEPLWTSP
ncbi:O-antigen ligase family protein [Diaminobutyricimonas sp. TR449]|uniref:O-antigen ligase family protein n=1 Tax=Diaminobutyricimonas sp. TR449 TaxID=2708076 RepID=UPI0014230F07|nr:O-antigen ligase family protein [Diaminobutyricimonas sp. TR449]